MTENKRFTLDFIDHRTIFIDDKVTEKTYEIINDTTNEKYSQEIVDLLNELHEENKELRKMLKHSYRLLAGVKND